MKWIISWFIILLLFFGYAVQQCQADTQFPASGGVTALCALADVDCTSIADGAILIRDHTGDSTWDAIAMSGDCTMDKTGVVTCSFTDTNANTICAGTTTYLDGEGNCDDLSAVYQPLDADLTIYAGITPSANVQSLLAAADYAAMRTLLGLVIGTNVQAYDADLTTYAGITPSANVQSLLAAADYAAMRVLLSLVVGTDVQAYDADLTTYAGITPSANVQSILGAADYAAIRTLLGLVIGTNVQAWDTQLDSLAALAYATNANKVVAVNGTETGFELVTAGGADTNASTICNGTTTYLDGDGGCDDLSTVYQPLDADLTTYAGITPSANVQSVLGAADYAAIRTLLNLVIGTDVQAYDADLTTYAGITPSANVQSILGAADYAAIRTLLGLVIGTNVQAYDADLTTYAGITPSANVQSILGAADYAAIRALLSIGAIGLLSSVDISANTNLGGGRSLSMNGDDVDADAELYTHEGCVTKLSPATDEEFYTVWRAPTALTITQIYCEVTGGTSVLADLEVDDGTPTGVNGSDITCDTTGVTDSTLAGDTTMAAGDRLDLDLGTVTGTVTQLSVCMRYTLDD